MDIEYFNNINVIVCLFFIGYLIVELGSFSFFVWSAVTSVAYAKPDTDPRHTKTKTHIE